MTTFAMMVMVLGRVRQWWAGRDIQWMDSTAERRQMLAKHNDINMRLD